MPDSASPVPGAWPELPLGEWQATCATLHLWTQIVGKIRLVQSAWINHSWHVTLYVTPRGLSSSPIPFGKRSCQIDFDLVDHRLLLSVSDGGLATLALRPRPVADFYGELMAKLAELGLAVTINTTPSELADGIPFEQDFIHASYDSRYAHRFGQALVQADRVLKTFRRASPANAARSTFSGAASTLR